MFLTFYLDGAPICPLYTVPHSHGVQYMPNILHTRSSFTVNKMHIMTCSNVHSSYSRSLLILSQVFCIQAIVAIPGSYPIMNFVVW